MIHHVIVLFASLAASLLFLYGWYGHQLITKDNQCKMTYSHPKKTLIRTTGGMNNYKLWKITNADSKKLNKYPVLFVPGHLGSVDQSRSFASYMHNDDAYLQYFSVDFNNEPIALHGADILSKANYINEAINAIVSLYENSGRANDLRIGLLGHSYGGFVAKTSMLLSNHPNKCLVKLLVMLSTPNLKAPFSPESSFDKLFFEVNKGWYQSYYNDKSKCPSKDYGEDRIELLPCSNCLKNVTVLSFSGGEIDFQVRPETTNIFDISARPKNITLIRQSTKAPGMVSLSLFSSVRRQLVQYGKKALSSIFSSTSVNATASNGSSTAITGELLSTKGANPEESTPLLEIPVLPESINSSSPFATLTADSWFKDMATYSDPHHISVRTSQITDVGFPVDHYAILWCYEFVSIASAAMKKILRKPYGPRNDFELHQLLKVRNVEFTESFLSEPRKVGIPQLLNYIRRNETNNDFNRIADEEITMMNKVIEGNFMQAHAVQLFLHHAQKLPVGFFNMAIISIIGTFLSLLLGEAYASTPTSSLVSIMNVFDLRPYIRLFRICWNYGTTTVGSSINLLGVIGALVAIAAWRFQWDLDVADEVVSTFLALWVAVAIKLILAVIIVLIRAIANLLNSFTVVDTCWTLLDDLSQFVFRGLLSALLGRLVETAATIIVLSASISSGYHTAVLLESGTPISVLILWSFTANFLHMLLNLTGSSRPKGENGQLMDDLLFLQIFGLVCCIPTVTFAYNNIFIARQTILFRTGIFDLFGSDRINGAMTLVSLWLLGSNIYNFRSKLQIEPMNGFRIIIEPPASLSSQICLHEDGGYKAVFEAVVPCAEQKKISKDIVDGPTYKVVQCFCPTNRGFKSAEEWCEWCRCQKCGYGKLIRATAGISDDGDKPRLHLDMIVILALVGALFYMNYWGENRIYMLFYSTGVVFFILWVRLFFKKGTFVLPEK